MNKDKKILIFMEKNNCGIYVALQCLQHQLPEVVAFRPVAVGTENAVATGHVESGVWRAYTA